MTRACVDIPGCGPQHAIALTSRGTVPTISRMHVQHRVHSHDNTSRLESAAQRTSHGLIPEAVLQQRAPLVLTLSGAGCDPCLFDGVRVEGIAWYAVDWFQGEGAFDPESVAQRLADALASRAGPTLIAGHSLGGFIALLMAIRHGQHVQGLVLSNTGARTEGHGDPGLPDRVRTDWTPANQQSFLRACFMHEPPPALWSRLCQYLAHLPAEHLLAAVTGLRKLDVSGELGRVRCPTLIAHGRFDRRRTEAAAQLMADGIVGAQLDWLPGGHTPMVDCPDDYQQSLQAFLTRTGFIEPRPLERP